MSSISRLQGKKSVTTAGTAVPLSATSVGFKELIIQANPANTGKIYVGGVLVDNTNGITLFPTYLSPALNGGDLADIYIDASVNGEGVTFLYVES